MSTLRDQVYDVALGVLPALQAVGLADATALLGGPASAPPPAPTVPYLYLRLEADFPRMVESNRWDGGFTWLAYDALHTGYVRAKALLHVLRAAYLPVRRNETIFHDPLSGEDVYWLDAGALQTETVDQARVLIYQAMEWSWRKAYRGDLP